VARATGVELAPGAPAHLRHVSKSKGDGDLRPYLPGAVCKILTSICAFAKLRPVLDTDMIERVAAVYFTHASATKGDKPPSLGSISELAGARQSAPPEAPPEPPGPPTTADRLAAFVPAGPAPTPDAAPVGTAAANARVDSFLSGPPPAPPAPTGPSWAVSARRGDAEQELSRSDMPTPTH
jgi:hypothetical protein